MTSVIYIANFFTKFIIRHDCKLISSSIGDDDVESDDRWGSPNHDGGEDDEDDDNGGEGYRFDPSQYQPPFQNQFGIGMPPPRRGIPFFLPNWGGYGVGTPFTPPGPLVPVPTPPIRPSTAPPGSPSDTVCLKFIDLIDSSILRIYTCSYTFFIMIAAIFIRRKGHC